MGIVIRATGASTSADLKSSIAHAAHAGRACLSAAGVGVDHVDCLIHVGIYRDRNMVEPSMAALVQRQLGMCLDFVKHAHERPAFSFDLMNSACGPLNAVQVATGILHEERARSVLVVSGDAHPGDVDGRVVEGDFPFARSGGAFLLERGRADEGFGRVYTASSFDEGALAQGRADATPGRMGVRGSVAIERGERFAERLAALLGDLALRVVDEEQLDVARTLIVAPRFSSDAPALLAQRLGAPLENLAPIDLDGDPHSSTLALAWHAATAHGMVERFDRALFLLGGAGLTAAAAAYTVPRA